MYCTEDATRNLRITKGFDQELKLHSCTISFVNLGDVNFLVKTSPKIYQIEYR